MEPLTREQILEKIEAHYICTGALYLMLGCINRGETEKQLEHQAMYVPLTQALISDTKTENNIHNDNNKG